MTRIFVRFISGSGFFLFLFSMIACNPYKKVSKDYPYLQRGLDSLGTVTFKESLIQPNDLLSIQVFSKSINQEQASLFNIPNTGTGTSNGYLVNMDGTIEIPLVGFVKAAGLTRAQLGTDLATKIAPYVKDPSILIRFMQFKVSVLGEVKAPGSYNFLTERVTILDALSAAGDLTENAQRSGILVVREEKGIRKHYQVDLRSGALFQSPVFQLQQNDLIYVNANEAKLDMLKSNPNAVRNIGLGISIASLLLLIYEVFKP
jgi:polysaccharide export outer membrane protein